MSLCKEAEFLHCSMGFPQKRVGQGRGSKTVPASCHNLADKRYADDVLVKNADAVLKQYNPRWPSAYLSPAGPTARKTGSVPGCTLLRPSPGDHLVGRRGREVEDI